MGTRLSPRQREALAAIAAGRFYPCLVREDDGWYARWRGTDCDSDWIDRYVREAAVTPLTEDAEDQRHETLHDAWLAALASTTGRVAWDDAECAAFAAELEKWSEGAVENSAVRSRMEFSFSSSSEGFFVSCAVPKDRAALRELGRATFVWGPLRGMRMSDDGQLRVALSKPEAEDFLRGGARDLVNAGYAVAGADISAKVSADAEIESPEKRRASENAKIKLVVRVAGEPVTANEIQFLLDQGSSLVFFRNRWIEVDRGILRMALRALEKGVSGKSSAMHFALGLGHVGALEMEEVRAHGWVRGLVESLRRAGDSARSDDDTDIAAPPGFVGTLRDYQRRGVRWLRFMTDNGFGALLADDMGLGKTIQTIAWMLSARRKGPVLVVAPLTLLENWRHEFAMFAPSLSVHLHHGHDRHVASGFRDAANGSDVTLTSYNLLVRDYADISGIAWDALVLDEAQTVKNHATRAAQAALALSPRCRIAITGTPVENSVADVWAIENFLNPGLLGDRKSFVERFARPIAADPGCAAGKRLHRALEPFILRRLKTAPDIAAELGPKRELREYCELTPAQRAEYDGALAEFRAAEHRQGDVFALITNLKLICDGEGKVARLLDLLEAIFENGESALVFSQYAKVGGRLRAAMEERFGRRFPFLHGGLSASARTGEIDAFNRSGPSALVLSLRAGGFGLNLTKATHVIHFDRWWNPAVESQATDRAHRIGQTKTVFSHLFISSATIEERVDELLRRKSLEASAVITEAEWLEAAGV